MRYGSVEILLLLCQDYDTNVTWSVKSDAAPTEVDETQSHLQPFVVLEILNLARYIILLLNF